MKKNKVRFGCDFRVRFAEVDYQGVVFNAHYLTYLDTALTEYMRHLGMDVSLDHNPKTADFQLIKTTLEFKAPAKFDDVLWVTVQTHKIGNSSITFHAEIFKKQNSQLLLTADLVWVYADLVAQQSMAIPPAIRDVFARDVAHEAAIISGENAGENKR